MLTWALVMMFFEVAKHFEIDLNGNVILILILCGFGGILRDLVFFGAAPKPWWDK